MKKRCFLFFMCLAVFTSVSYSQQKNTKKQGPLFPVIQNGKWGYINKAGKIVIEPQFTVAQSFSEELAVVKIGDKWGYIDKTGRTVIKPQFDWAWEFSEGLAVIEIGSKYGYIDKTGKMVIELQFSEVWSFSEELV